LGHFLYHRGSPAALKRIPPISQTDLAQPHEHRTIHKRESASMASIQRCGRTAEKNLWKKLIAIFSFLALGRRRFAFFSGDASTGQCKPGRESAGCTQSPT
jgi:hypothetical protein